jgi:hypothetical protein
MTPPSSEPIERAHLRDFLYRRREGSDPDDLNDAARGWMDAVHAFATDALDSGVAVTEVLSAVLQMLEGWMLARAPDSMMTSWMALDGAVTVMERRLAEMRAERDRLATVSASLLAEEAARRARRKRGKRDKRGRGGKGKK